MTEVRRSRWVLALGILGVLACLFLVAPVLIVIATSFNEGRRMEFPPRGFSLRWYEVVATDPRWTARLGTSLQVATLSAALSTILGAATALGLVRGAFPGKRFAFALVLSPLVVPIVIVAVGTYFVWVQGWQLGPISIGGGLAGTVPGLVLAHSVLTLPFPIITTATALRTMDHNLELAAMNLGADGWATFRHVTLPIIFPGVLAGAVFAFVTSWDEVVVALFLTSPRVSTVPVEIWGQLRTAVDPTAPAVSTVLLLVTTLLLGGMLVLRQRGPAR